MKTIDIAQDYIARGWAPIPIPWREKKPIVAGWPSLRLDDSNVDQHFNGRPSNIGVLMGTPSGLLVDIDLDHELAVAMAPDFLPPTASRFGRASNPNSHWLYRVTGSISTAKFESTQGMIVELRSTGCQTVFPGSTHKDTGEVIEWAEDGEPLEISPDELLACVRNLAEYVALTLGEPLKEKAPPTPPATPAPQRVTAGRATALDRCIKYLAKIPPGISKQGGHKATYYAACLCIRFGLSESEAMQAMESFNARCQPPWSTKELEHKLSHATKAVAAENKVGAMVEKSPTMEKADPDQIRKAQAAWDERHPPADTNEEADDDDDLIARCAADVKTRPVSWFWRNKFVAGAINLLIGMPDVGKSVVTCDIAARKTTGDPWPPVDGERAENSVGSVLFFAAEDSPETTLVPRLRAAGADLSKVHFIEGVNRDTAEGKVRDQFDIQRDVMHLRRMHKRIPDLGLVIIDPLDSYISAKTDTNVGNQARAALWPLKDWAEETGITVIIVHHFNKSATTNAMDKVSGARSFGALPRSVWAVGRDPEDERRTILAPIKLNLVKQEAKKAIAYEIKSSLADADQPCVHWMDEDISVTAGDIVAGKQTQKCKAADWLRDMLANGPMPAKELEGHAEDAGMPWGTVKKAKEEAGVVSEQIYEGKRIVGWEWRLK